MTKKVQIAAITPATGPAKRSRAPKTTWAQYVAILEWLEIPANFNLIEGSATSTMKTGTVAGAKLTKRTAFAELADAVNEKCNTNWDRVTSENRFRVYKRLFKQTKRNQLDPGGAKYNVGPKDHAKGVFTIEQKLEKDCPYFQRMDILYGGRQNITPACVLVGTKRSASQITAAIAAGGDEDSSDDDDKEDSSTGEVEEDEEEIANESGEEDIEEDDQAECALALASLAAVTGTADTPSSTAVSTLSPPSPTGANGGTKKQTPAAPRTSKKPKKDKPLADKTALLPTALKEKCAETVGTAANAAELTAKITEMKNTGTGKGRKDFTSTYADAKTKEIELARDKFEFEKENYHSKRSDDNSHEESRAQREQENSRAQLQSNTKNVIIMEMIRKGSSAQEIKEFLELLL